MSRRASSKSTPKTRDPKLGRIEQEQHVLKAQIGVLESFLAGAPARSRAHRIANRDTLPAPEVLRRKVQQKTMLGVQALVKRANSRRHFFQFLMLLSIWASVASWLWFFWIKTG